jgi:hypothetical protein
MSIDQSLVELEIETRNFEHIREIEAVLNQTGYHMGVKSEE